MEVARLKLEQAAGGERDDADLTRPAFEQRHLAEERAGGQGDPAVPVPDRDPALVDEEHRFGMLTASDHGVAGRQRPRS